MTQVQGLAELERRWSKIPALVRQAAREAMEDVAQGIVTDMKRAAPRGATSSLVNSIGWTWGEAPAGAMTVGTVGGREYGSMRITIYAGGGKAFYARYLEFGTSKMVAHPFFYPVWRTRRRSARSRITRRINKAIRSS